MYGFVFILHPFIFVSKVFSKAPKEPLLKLLSTSNFPSLYKTKDSTSLLYSSEAQNLDFEGNNDI